MSAQIIQLSTMTKKLDNPPNRLREQRQKRRMTLHGLAAQTGLDPAYISKMETGERPTKIEHLRSIANVFGIAIGDLLNAQDVPESLDDMERTVVDAMRADPMFAHSVATLAEARSTYRLPPKILPFKRSG